MALRDGITDHPTKSNLTSTVFNAKLEQARVILDLLQSATTGEGVSLLGIEDAGGYFSGLNPEAVLQLLGLRLMGWIHGGRRRWEKKDDDEYYINIPFSIEINGSICSPAAQITKQDGSLPNSAWLYVYAKVPGSGTVLTDAEILHSTTAPTFDLAKRGWYNGSAISGKDPGDLRCFAFFRTDSSGDIIDDVFHEDRVHFPDVVGITPNPNPSDSWETVSFPLPNLGKIMGHANAAGAYVDTDVLLKWKPTDHATGALPLFNISSAKTSDGLHFTFLTDGDQDIDIMFDAATTLTYVWISASMMFLPDGM